MGAFVYPLFLLMLGALAVFVRTALPSAIRFPRASGVQGAPSPACASAVPLINVTTPPLVTVHLVAPAAFSTVEDPLCIRKLPFFTVNRSFFMSLFFLISGYLMVMSYDRGGPGRFLKGRLLRLGVPLVLFFTLVTAVSVPLVFLLSAVVRGPALVRRIL